MANLGANRGPAPVNRPQPGEAFFQQSIADLSKRLDERDAKQSTSGPEAAAEARRRAMRAYELERGRKLRLLLTGAAAVVATACIAWFVVLLGEPEGAAAPGPIASAQPSPSASPASPVVIASAVPAPEAPQAAEAPPPPPPAPPPVVEAQPPSAPPPPPQQTAAAQPSEPPPVEPAQAARPLGRNEIREVQKRLAGFGFNPGPIDGVAGQQTEVAAQRYLEARGQPQMPPTEPQLLDQLRQDSAPQVAQRPQPRAVQASAAPPSARRSFDPFEPVKVAGAQITQWLQSAFR